MPVPAAARILLLCSLLCSGVVSLCAQILEPVTWTFSTEVVDGQTSAVFAAKIDEGWNVYSQYLESDDGPVATEIVYDISGDARLLEGNVESGHRKEGFDDLFEMNVVKFAGDYQIRQRVDFSSGEPLAGYLTFMVCDAVRCLPPTDVDFSFAAPLAEAKSGVGTETGDVPGDVTTPQPEPLKNFKPAETNLADKQQAPAVVARLEAAEVERQTEVLEEGGVIAVTKKKPRFAQPVTWTFSSTAVAGSSDEYVLSMSAAIEQGWTVYAQDNVEDGPVPTTFAFREAEGYELVGEAVAEGKRKVGFDKAFGVEVAKYLAPTVTWQQRVRVSDPSAEILGYLEFMTCDETQCLPPEEVPFRFLPNQGMAGGIDFATYDKLIAGGDESAPEAPVASANGDLLSGYRINKELDDATCGKKQVAVDVEESDSLLTIFLLGFGGGLLALLTPCVFPMIPLTVSFFTAAGTNKRRGLRRALGYGLSIIGIYVTLGLLITGLFGADALNQLSTNAWFNILFGVLFLVFALSFFGFFEITLPSAWANKSDRAADQGGALGIFFMAFTLSLVSFSCTGPIIGTLLVQTATGGGATILGRIPVAPLLGMLGFATALAAPFTVFAAFPTALSALPKSGGWMNTVKVTLGFVEAALALKFLSTADLILGTKWMPYELFTAAWVLCALGLAAYYFGWLKTPLERYGKQKVTPLTIGLGVLATAFAVYVGLGFRYDDRSQTFNTPLVLSGLAPPAGHSYIYPKECPQNLDCFKDYDAGLAYAKQVGKPVLVDFTGHGCVNCRKMEDNVWGEPGVYEKLRDDYVLVSLYVDEREVLEEPFVSDFSQRTLRTVGNKWADFQARYFDRNSQPYYVLMSPEGDVLNQPVPYTPDVEEYAAFLDCGLQQWEKVKGQGDEALIGESGLN